MKKILQSSNWGSIGSWSMALRRELKETALSAPGAANGRTSQGFTNSIEILPNSSQQLCSCYKRRKSLKILNGVFFETIRKLNYFCILCKDIWLFSFIILIKHQSAFSLIDFRESISAFSPVRNSVPASNDLCWPALTPRSPTKDISKHSLCKNGLVAVFSSFKYALIRSRKCENLNLENSKLSHICPDSSSFSKKLSLKTELWTLMMRHQ